MRPYQILSLKLLSFLYVNLDCCLTFAFDMVRWIEYSLCLYKHSLLLYSMLSVCTAKYFCNFVNTKFYAQMLVGKWLYSNEMAVIPFLLTSPKTMYVTLFYCYYSIFWLLISTVQFEFSLNSCLSNMSFVIIYFQDGLTKACLGPWNRVDLHSVYLQIYIAVIGCCWQQNYGLAFQYLVSA